MKLNSFQSAKSFKLENGQQIENLEITYTTYGKLNKQKDNVIWVCHALTADSNVMNWWNGLFGENKVFNPDEHFIICANILGSPYGTTNPLSINPITKLPYYLSFPQFTIRDIVAAHQLLAAYLGVQKVKVLIGGSLGGQQAVEWAIAEPNFIKQLVLLATNAQHSPWGIAFNESQRLAISSDPTFYSNRKDGGTVGLKVARSIALLSYRTYEIYSLTQAETSDEVLDDFKASSYQNYQGEKLTQRFNAYSYWFLTKAMDGHNVGRNRGGVIHALQTIQAETLVIGIKNDFLFPVQEQQLLANTIPNSRYYEMESLYGHDGFLVETKVINKEIKRFLKIKKITK